MGLLSRVQGRANVKNVAFHHCGKRTSNNFALLIDSRGTGAVSGFVQDCVFRYGYNSAVAAAGLLSDTIDFNLFRNIVYQTPGTAFSLQSTLNSVTTNLAVSTDLALSSNTGGVGFDAHSYESLNQNVAIGSATYGFLLSAGPCSGLPSIGNSAQSSRLAGVHIVTAAAASWYFATYIPVYQVYEIPGININRTQSKILGGTGQPPSLFAGGLVVVTSLLFCYY